MVEILDWKQAMVAFGEGKSVRRVADLPDAHDEPDWFTMKDKNGNEQVFMSDAGYEVFPTEIDPEELAKLRADNETMRDGLKRIAQTEGYAEGETCSLWAVQTLEKVNV